MRTDHYQVLGLSPQASHEEVRAAYLRLMRASHPDTSPDDPEAAERARQANAAWEVLGDAARRAAYDRLRSSQRHSRPGVRAISRAPHPHPTVHPAYSQARRDFARAFQRASMRIAVALMLVSMTLLLTIAL